MLLFRLSICRWAIGATARSVSTIVVAANAQLLRRLRLRRDAPAMQPKLATA